MKKKKKTHRVERVEVKVQCFPFLLLFILKLELIQQSCILRYVIWTQNKRIKMKKFNWNATHVDYLKRNETKNRKLFKKIQNYVES